MIVVDVVFTVSMDHPLPLRPRHIGKGRGFKNIEISTDQFIVGKNQIFEIELVVKPEPPCIEMEDDRKDTVSHFGARQMVRSAVTVIADLTAADMLVDGHVDAAAL